MEETVCARIEWNTLSTPASDGNKSATKTLGMPRGQNFDVEAWQKQCLNAWRAVSLSTEASKLHVCGKNGHSASG